MPGTAWSLSVVTGDWLRQPGVAWMPGDGLGQGSGTGGGVFGATGPGGRAVRTSGAGPPWRLARGWPVGWHVSCCSPALRPGPAQVAESILPSLCSSFGASSAFIRPGRCRPRLPAGFRLMSAGADRVCP